MADQLGRTTCWACLGGLDSRLRIYILHGLTRTVNDLLDLAGGEWRLGSGPALGYCWVALAVGRWQLQSMRICQYESTMIDYNLYADYHYSMFDVSVILSTCAQAIFGFILVIDV